MKLTPCTCGIGEVNAWQPFRNGTAWKVRCTGCGSTGYGVTAEDVFSWWNARGWNRFSAEEWERVRKEVSARLTIYGIVIDEGGESQICTLPFELNEKGRVAAEVNAQLWRMECNRSNK